jgi:predicted extracellular nuclease
MSRPCTAFRRALRRLPPIAAVAAGLAACGSGPGSSGADPVRLPAFECGARITPIHAIQGAGPGSRYNGVVVDTEGVVTAKMRGLGGFFIQAPREEWDDDEATSEGLFVASDPPLREVRIGARVRVRGSVVEAAAPDAADAPGLTSIGVLNQLAVCGEPGLPDALPVTAPPVDWERYEGMRIALPGPVVVTGNHELLRFGRAQVSLDGRLFQPTEHFAPGPEARELAAANARAMLTIDDNLEVENPRRIWWLRPAVGANEPWRVGTTLTGLVGVLDERDGRMRLQLTAEPASVEQAPRPAGPPVVGGDISVASFNLLNWFNGDGKGGGFPTTRGASSSAEMQRQRAKLVAALAAMKPDVLALMELENDGYGDDSAIAQLVAALNAKLGDEGDYRLVDPGVPALGGDDIAVGMIYRERRVAAVGPAAHLAEGAFARLNRVPLAQTFAPVAGGPAVTVVANHFKSKGGCDEAMGSDLDRGDGQACFNGARVAAARELADWLAGDPTGSGSTDVLIVGDLNAHAEEDPLRLLRQRGYVDSLTQFAGKDAYSFVFNGLSGRLDHALASASLAPRVASAAEWHANADELTVFDYNTEFKSERRRKLYRADPYRASDHDPLVVGLDSVGVGGGSE